MKSSGGLSKVHQQGGELVIHHELPACLEVVDVLPTRERNPDPWMEPSTKPQAGCPHVTSDVPGRLQPPRHGFTHKRLLLLSSAQIQSSLGFFHTHNCAK